MNVQPDTFRCEHCGRLAAARPTHSPWEFDVDCDCGRSYQLSWKHDEPPPVFTPTPPDLQQRLPMKGTP